jgi:hypothetical protein
MLFHYIRNVCSVAKQIAEKALAIELVNIQPVNLPFK